MFTYLALALVSFAHAADSKYKPLPVPKNIRVTSSAPRAQVWDALTDNEKKLAYHLIEASRAGRTIMFNQNHRLALVIKKVLEEALSPRGIDYTKKFLGDSAFQELLGYAAKFEDLAGPYESSNRKYVLSEVKPEQVEELFKVFGGAHGVARRDAIRLMTDPDFEVIQYPEDAEGSDLSLAGGNLYEHGMTGAQVAAAMKAGLKSNLNCRIATIAHDEPYCQVQALNNPELPAIVRVSMAIVVQQLRMALPYTLTPHQHKQIESLIKYLEEGNVEDFRQSNIEWVLDRTNSKVDFMMGYVEVYQDYLNQIGSWESYVQIVDPPTTELSVNLARNAQYFENQMPYGQFKKTFPENYSPPALMVYYFQEISSFHSGGYNLPNFDDIRRDVGAKNIIRLDLPGTESDPLYKKIYREAYAEFLPADKVGKVLGVSDKIWRTLVLLHEIIGHGSGTYDTTKYGKTEDPVSALGALGSALEEQRADQSALVFVSDPKLVSVGIYKDQAEADLVREAMYDWYLADFMRRAAKQRTFTEAHMRGHWLIVKLLLEKGAIEMVARDGSAAYTPENMVLRVKDYAKYYEVSRDLLGELQRIKAVRDEAALKTLFTEHAPLDAINEPWAQAVIARGAKLAISAGSIEQPWRVGGKSRFRLLGDTSLEGVAQVFRRQ